MKKPKSETINQNTETIGRIECYGKDLVETKERIRKTAERWLDPLGLRWWRKIELEYAPEIDQEKANRTAKAEVFWNYREAFITFYLPNLIDKSDEDIDYIVRHEFMHLLVNEMREDPSDNCDHEERVCTELAMAFEWVRNMAAKGKL